MVEATISAFSVLHSEWQMEVWQPTPVVVVVVVVVGVVVALVVVVPVVVVSTK